MILLTIATRRLSTVARSFREASKLNSITSLDLSSSDSFICKNMMCEYVGGSCICRLALWTHQNQTKLSTLQSLNLANNELVRLPDTIFELKSLEYLDLSHNKLEMLPKNVTQLSSLTTLDLRGNPLSTSLLAGEHDDDLLLLSMLKQQQCTVLLDESTKVI